MSEQLITKAGFNKVKKGRYVETEIYMERARERMPVEKYTWFCTVCGREWLMQQDAKRCRHVDVTHYGRRPISCLSKPKS